MLCSQWCILLLISIHFIWSMQHIVLLHTFVPNCLWHSPKPQQEYLESYILVSNYVYIDAYHCKLLLISVELSNIRNSYCVSIANWSKYCPNSTSSMYWYFLENRSSTQNCGNKSNLWLFCAHKTIVQGTYTFQPCSCEILLTIHIRLPERAIGFSCKYVRVSAR